MNYKVVITDKNGVETTFSRIVLGITIDRRLNMQTASANTVLHDVKNTVLPNLYSFTGVNGIISNGNKVQIYISDDYRFDKIQFTGIIRDFSPNDTEQTISINCHDMACRILRPIDEGIPYHIFDNISATELINVLAQKAGLGNTKFNINTTNDYIIKKLKMQYDVQISDIIDQALATLEARARVLKDGTYYVENLYPNYKKTDPDNNVNYDFVIEDFEKISNMERKRNSATLYNRLLVRYNEKSYSVFEEPNMINYLGYRNFKEIDAPLGDTQDKRKKIANKFFLDAWRENTNLDAVMTKGNPNIDIGKIARLKLNNKLIGHYLITGVRTELTPDNYIDTLTLDGMRENVDIAQLSNGNYTLKN
jgi:hypothetical protein